jgi:predicted small metal-binding protein
MLSLTCRDAGFDCPEVIRGNTEEEVLQKAATHGQESHGMQQSDMTPELTGKLRSIMRQE